MSITIYNVVHTIRYAAKLDVLASDVLKLNTVLCKTSGLAKQVCKNTQCISTIIV